VMIPCTVEYSADFTSGRSVLHRNLIIHPGKCALFRGVGRFYDSYAWVRINPEGLVVPKVQGTNIQGPIRSRGRYSKVAQSSDSRQLQVSEWSFSDSKT